MNILRLHPINLNKINILLILIISSFTLFQLTSSEDSSAASASATASDILTHSEDEPNPAEIQAWMNPGDDMSMEDLASKEKVIVVPEVSLPPFLFTTGRSTTSTTTTSTTTTPSTTTTTDKQQQLIPTAPPQPPPPTGNEPLTFSEEEEGDGEDEEDEDQEENEEEDDEENEDLRQIETNKQLSPTISLPPENLHKPPPPPLPLTKAPFDEDLDEKLFLILQNSVRETYFAFRDVLGTKHRTELSTLENDLRQRLQQLDVDLNVKVVALDTTTHSRIQTLTDKIIDQRKEDIQTFSDNLHHLQKTHQMHLDTQRVEIQQLQATVDLITKGQSSLATKLSQLQKLVNTLDSKLIDLTGRTGEELSVLKEGQKVMSGVVDEVQISLKTTSSELQQLLTTVSQLQKAASEDSGKLRRTLIRDQKQEPLLSAIRLLRSKNVPGALKQWRAIESIADDLKETLPSDVSKIVEESQGGKNPPSLSVLAEFVHRAIGSSNDRRLKEAAYAALLSEFPKDKGIVPLTDAKRTLEIFHLAQAMKADLGMYYNQSSLTSEIVSRLPPIIKLITFDRVRLLLPKRGYLRVASDRKVSLVPPDARFYEKEETLWQFEFDPDRDSGTFYIKSEKLQKYLVTHQEGFNSYGFSKQGLFVTGNKRENGTRFQLTVVNGGEYVLLRSVYYNGFLTWKSNVQTVYGDDDSYFLLLVDRTNGPSPYWVVVGGGESSSGGGGEGQSGGQGEE